MPTSNERKMLSSNEALKELTRGKKISMKIMQDITQPEWILNTWENNQYDNYAGYYTARVDT